MTNQLPETPIGPPPALPGANESLVTLPEHGEVKWLQRSWELGCIVAATGLLMASAARLIVTSPVLEWWLVLVVLAGAVFADVLSGLIHWSADTWGSQEIPVLGKRFLRPFRVHHVNPDDFLRRDFVNTNGDVAMVTLPFLALSLGWPIDTPLDRTIATFLLSLSAMGLPTNQVHQWAHRPQPPRAVRWLQRYGIILSRGAHDRHHQAPYATNYCIANGWCNRAMAALDVLPRLERLVTRLTGRLPRRDDTHFQEVIEAGRGGVPRQPPGGRPDDGRFRHDASSS